MSSCSSSEQDTEDLLEGLPDTSATNQLASNKVTYLPSEIDVSEHEASKKDRKYHPSYFIINGEKYELLVKDGKSQPSTAPLVKSTIHIPEGSSHGGWNKDHLSQERQSELEICGKEMSQLSISGGHPSKEVGKKCKQKLRHVTGPEGEMECAEGRDSSPGYFTSHSQRSSRQSSYSPERRHQSRSTSSGSRKPRHRRKKPHTHKKRKGGSYAKSERCDPSPQGKEHHPKDCQTFPPGHSERHFHKAGKGKGGKRRHDDRVDARRKHSHSPMNRKKEERSPSASHSRPKHEYREQPRSHSTRSRKPIAELSRSFWPRPTSPVEEKHAHSKQKGKKRAHRSPASASSSSSDTSSTDSDSDSDSRSYSRHRRHRKRVASRRHRRAGSDTDSSSSSRDHRHQHRHRRHRRSRSRSKAPALPSRFDGDSEALAPYLNQLLNHFDDYWHHYRSDNARISAITRSLDGKASQWAVGLNESRSPLLYNFKDFVSALKDRFEDAQLRRQGRNKLRTIKQGNRSVKDYNEEFLSLLRFVPEWSPAAILFFFFL